MEGVSMETTTTGNGNGIESRRSFSGKSSLNISGASTPSFSLRCASLNSIRLHRIFDLFDKNGDNMITVDELSQALSLLGLETDFSDLEATVNTYIKPGNEGLEFDDFAALHKSLDDALFGTVGADEEDDDSVPYDQDCEDQTVMASPDNSQGDSDLTEAFKVFDEDGDGYISAHELQVVLRKLGFPEWREIDRVEQMIVSVDRNHDGRVDFLEFKDMMRNVIQSS